MKPPSGVSGSRRLPLRLVGFGGLLVAVGAGVSRARLLPGVGVSATGVLVSAAAVAGWWPARRSSSGLIGRWTRKSRKHQGVASWWDHLRVSSAWAMRRKATVLRPSLAQMGRLQRRLTPVTEYATRLARVGWHTIWSPCEDVTLRVGGPRTGKTGELSCRIVDAPGAVIATSTRTDIVELTAPLRLQRGPVHMFNPSGLGGWASTIKWSPLVGCRIPGIAARRASDMIPPSVSAEAERWDIQARRVLSVLMHAAALGNLPMQTVLAWVSDPGPKNALWVDTALGESPEAKTMRLSAEQFFGMNDRTKTSITATIMPALGWLTDSRAAAVGDPTGDDRLDVRQLLDQRGTVYLLGAEDGLTAPLIAALTAEIAHQARMAAAGMPGGRLDPPLTVALDEAALICPVPLDRWTADMGGRGITLHISIQSRAQLRQRWGDAGAATILNNTASILVYGGTRDPDDLMAWSTLSGEREEHAEARDSAGKVTGTTSRRVPVLSHAQVANLPAGHAMIVRRGMPVSIGRTVMAWRRRDIRKALRSNPYRPVTETNYTEDLADKPSSEPGGETS